MYYLNLYSFLLSIHVNKMYNTFINHKIFKGDRMKKLIIMPILLGLLCTHVYANITYEKSINKMEISNEVNYNQDQSSELPNLEPNIDDKNINKTETDEIEIDEPNTKTINISAVGDLTLGSDLEHGYYSSFVAKYDNVGNTSYFLENVVPVLSQDDLTIGNFEGTLTYSENRADKTYAFKGYPDFANILVDGSVEAVTLANNHTYDYGDEGYVDTVNNLNAAGITNFDINRNAIYEVDDVKIGLVGLKAWSNSTYYEDLLLKNIEDVKTKGADIIIVSFHWGNEGDNYPTDYQQKLGHLAIDNGADLVLGHHSHVLQGIEHYKGKSIVYSLANFCFGGNRNPKDKDTIIYQHEFVLDENNNIINESENIIPTMISSTPTLNDFKPTIATGEDSIRILSKMNTYSSIFK